MNLERNPIRTRRGARPGLAAMVCALAALCGGQALAAYAPRNIRFDRISLEQGLSQSAINAILQDRDGFMWFGTEDGLNRFDGYTFDIYKNDTNDPASLSNNFVRSIVEDRHGVLWIGTDGGLNRWDRSTESFAHYRNDPEKPNSLSHDRVRVVYEDRDGMLWIGTDGGGLNRFDPRAGEWRRFSHNAAKPGSISNDHIRAIYQDGGGVLWVGTFGGGLNRYDPATEEFAHYRHDPEDPESISDDEIYTIYENRNGALWIGTYSGGLNRLDRESGRFTRFTHDPADPYSLGTGTVRVVYQDRDGSMWVGTDSGLNEWAPGGPGFMHYQHNPADPRSLSDNKVTTIFQDRGGVLWVGTKGDGLNKWNPWTGQFSWGREDPKAPSSLSSDRVFALQFDEVANVLWIGTYGGGLNRFDRDSGIYTHYRKDRDDPTALPDDRVMSLLLDFEGVLWVGTYDGGLNRLEPGGDTFTRFQHDPDDPFSIASNGVTSLFQDSNHKLWIGTYGGGMNRYDRETGKFYRYRHDRSVPTTLSSDRVTSFHEDSDGVMWIGTDGGGLNRFDRETGTFSHYHHDDDDPQSLSSDVVLSVHEDPDGVLWIGTQGGGLNRWEPADRRQSRAVFRHYSERDGLPNNVVYGLLSDEAGNLWISTNKGLSRFDPRAETFKTFDTTNGLLSNEFNFGAYHRSSAGEMFFGGIKGYNSFFPSDIKDNTYRPPVVLTSFLKLNQRVKLEQPISRTKQVVLKHTDYVVSFEFAALDYSAPERNRYAYKLEGLDADWNHVGTNRRATYTNLAAGDYVFRVMGSNNDGVWNEDSVALHVKVLPPPWKSWWAYSLYAAVLIGVVLVYTRAQTRKFAREAEYRRRLEQEVEARTQELAARNEELKDVNKRLEAASLTDQLTGLRNRRYLMTEIDKDIALSERYHKANEDGDERSASDADFLFLMVDLDGLKYINDTHGHMAGDHALLQIRDLLHEVCRKSDTIIRWGGDEFLIVGRNTNLASPESLAERLRSAVASHEFDLGVGQKIRLSCSIGCAQYPFLPWAPNHVSWEQVVTIADRALYAAKKSGRNAWVAIFPTEQTPAVDLVRLINDDVEKLVERGVVEIRTSIPQRKKLVWSRA